MIKTPLTGVDCNTSFIVDFSSSLCAQAVLSCNINAAPLNPGVTIRYERGNILIDQPIFCPKSFTVQYSEPGKSSEIVKEVKKEFKYVGRGLYFEADEVARCVRDGKSESELWGHDKSLLEMVIFDEVSTP
jgi:predicted dehydrogenase